MEKEHYYWGPALMQHVESCFLELLHQKSYGRITVVDICQKAQIARKTFYSYYTSKEACMCALMGHMVENALLYTYNQTADTRDFRKYYEAYLVYWKDASDFLDIVGRNHLEYLMNQAIVSSLLGTDKDILCLLDTAEVKADMDIIQSYVTCELSLMMQWCARGYDTPIEEMVEKLIRLIHRPFIPMSQTGKLWRIMLP